MWCSLVQVSYWRNSESLWRHTLACTPDNAIGQIKLGMTMALGEEGRWDVRPSDIIRRPSRSRPDRPFAYNGLGIALVSKDRGEEAIGYFSKAVEIQPDYAEAHYNLVPSCWRHATGRMKRPSRISAKSSRSIPVTPKRIAASPTCSSSGRTNDG